jgi:hypothetical protein
MDANELIKSIDVAFKGVKRPETSLRQFQLTDDRGMAGEITAEEWCAAGEARVDFRWQDIPDAEIKECGCLLAHMRAEEFRYYLPAYMCYSVKYYQDPIWEADILGSTVFSLYPSTRNEALYQYKIERLAPLSKEQKRVIVDFLRFVAESADDVERPYAEKALERYWNHNTDT